MYVLDFGLAKETRVDSSLSQTGHLLGTPAFMAPEQARGRIHEVDERTDVYGLGATLYACLAARPPFPGDDLVSVLQRIVRDDPPALGRLRPDLDRDLSTVVARAMAKEPQLRYATARDLAADLRRWLAAEPLLARPPSILYKLGRFARRRRGPIRAVLATAAIVGVAAVAGIVSERGARRGTERALELSNTVSVLVRDAEDAFRAGSLRVRDRKLEEAIALCRASLAEREVAEGRYLLGSLLYRRRRYADALAALDRALALEPALAEARFLRGLVLLEYAAQPPGRGGPPTLVAGHHLDQARRDLRVHRRSDLRFRRVDVLYGEARLAILDRDTARAREQLEAIVYELDPYHVEALRALADLVRAGDPDTALRLDSRAVDLERGEVRAGLRAAFEDVARVAAPRGGATVRFDEGGPPPPGSARAIAEAARETLARARDLASRGRVEETVALARETIADCDAALASDPELAGACNNRGVARALLEEVLTTQGRAFEGTTERMLAIRRAARPG